MNSTHTSAERMRAYLLGELDHDQASELELNYFTDPDCLRGLRETEDLLIRDYLQDRLNGHTKVRFELKYLRVPELLRRVEALRAGAAIDNRTCITPFDHPNE